MKPISRELRDLIGKPGGKPEEKKVAEQEQVVSKSQEKRLAVQQQVNSKSICQNCKAYDRQTKMCNGLKFVPRKGTCASFFQVGK